MTLPEGLMQNVQTGGSNAYRRFYKLIFIKYETDANGIYKTDARYKE